jgi:hypothetical protein
LRDVTLARAEEEVSREIALRIPVSNRALEELRVAALDRSHEASPELTDASVRPSALSVSYQPSGAGSEQR